MRGVLCVSKCYPYGIEFRTWDNLGSLESLVNCMVLRRLQLWILQGFHVLLYSMVSHDQKGDLKYK